MCYNIYIIDNDKTTATCTCVIIYILSIMTKLLLHVCAHVHNRFINKWYFAKET